MARELKDHVFILENFYAEPECDFEKTAALKIALKNIFDKLGLKMPQADSIKVSTQIGHETQQTNINIYISNADHELLYSMEVDRTGTILLIYEMVATETNKKNQLKKFPITCEDITFDYNEGKLFANGARVSIKYPKYDGIFMEPHHTPLHEISDTEFGYPLEEIIYLGKVAPETNTALNGIQIAPNSLKFILCRHAWGYNVSFAYYSPKHNTLFCGGTHNQDYPEPCGVEIIDNRLIMHCLKDEPDLKLVYKINEDFKPNVNIFGIFGNAESDAVYNIARLENELIMSHNTPPKTQEQFDAICELDHQLGNLPAQCDEFMNLVSKQYDIYRYDSSVLYNLACAHAVRNNIEEAIKYFAKAVKYGFARFRHAQNDADLDSIKSDPRFMGEAGAPPAIPHDPLTTS